MAAVGLSGCGGGFGPHADLLVADAADPTAASGVRVTYLGTNGYLIESGDTRLLIDPYFSRIGFGHAALNLPIAPNVIAIERHAVKLPDRIDAILVTHGHFDHLMDAPLLAQRTGARIIGSPTSMYLALAQGAAPEMARAVRPGEQLQISQAKVHVLHAEHDSLCCDAPPFPGIHEATPAMPHRASDWILGHPLAFLIELDGKRIYVDSGGKLFHGDLIAPWRQAAADPPIDLAIVGVALPDSRARYTSLIRALKPRFVLPSHQDDFFRPLDDGFFYGPMTDAQAVRQAHEQTGIGTMILLDYFTPWTLP